MGQIQIPIADKTTLDRVETNVGSNADAASGTGSAHAKIKELRALCALLETRLTATRAGKLDLVGSTGDSAGTSTLFARLAQIAGYVDTLESYLSGTLFNYINNINVVTGDIQWRVGAPSEGANPNGSANAKLNSLYALMFGGTPHIFDQYISGAGTSEVTALSVSGSGVLSFLQLAKKRSAADTSDISNVKVIVDGATIYNGVPVETARDASFFSSSYNLYSGLLRFASSLVVKFTLSASSNIWGLVANYKTGV